jgi:hypothetical protein
MRPDIINAINTACPATFAAIPVNVKTPEPIVAPRPRRTRALRS